MRQQQNATSFKEAIIQQCGWNWNKTENAIKTFATAHKNYVWMIDFLPVILLHREFSFQLCNLCPDCAEQFSGFGTFTWN